MPLDQIAYLPKSYKAQTSAIGAGAPDQTTSTQENLDQGVVSITKSALHLEATATLEDHADTLIEATREEHFLNSTQKDLDAILANLRESGCTVTVKLEGSNKGSDDVFCCSVRKMGDKEKLEDYLAAAKAELINQAGDLYKAATQENKHKALNLSFVPSATNSLKTVGVDSRNVPLKEPHIKDTQLFKHGAENQAIVRLDSGQLTPVAGIPGLYQVAVGANALNVFGEPVKNVELVVYHNSKFYAFREDKGQHNPSIVEGNLFSPADSDDSNTSIKPLTLFNEEPSLERTPQRQLKTAAGNQQLASARGIYGDLEQEIFSRTLENMMTSQKSQLHPEAQSDCMRKLKASGIKLTPLVTEGGEKQKFGFLFEHPNLNNKKETETPLLVRGMTDLNQFARAVNQTVSRPNGRYG